MPETAEGECVYCKQVTTWLVVPVRDKVVRFDCTRCCKISREVTLADTTAEEAT